MELPRLVKPSTRSNGADHLVHHVVERHHLVLGDEHPVARQDLVVRGRRAPLRDRLPVHRHDLLAAALPGAGRAIQIFVLESCDRPFTWQIASNTVSLPVMGKRRKLSPMPAPCVIT